MSTKTITMHDFFALPDVIAAQDMQKRSPYGSPEHRKAFDRIVQIAAAYGVASFFPDEY